MWSCAELLSQEHAIAGAQLFIATLELKLRYPYWLAGRLAGKQRALGSIATKGSDKVGK